MRLRDAAIWHGDPEAALEFLKAIDNNCMCEVDDSGKRSGACSAHRAMLSQRFIDGLLFARWMRERLATEERRYGSPIRR